MDGSWLMKLPGDDTGSTRMYGMHRRRLHAALLDAAGDAEVSTGMRVVHIDPGNAERQATIVVNTQGGEQRTTADLVIGADGVHSRLRSVLLPERKVVSSGYTSWRAIIPAVELITDKFAMSWGPHAEFGALPVGHGEVYWYGYAKCPPGTNFPDESVAVRERFADWHDAAQFLIAGTAPGCLMRHDVWVLDKALKSYARGRTVLIGDAAHPMLPTLGQGANSALEDGVTIGRLVPPRTRDIPAALRRVDQQRRPRTQGLVRQSAAMARIDAHLGPGWRQQVGNAMFRSMPAGLAQRSGGSFLNWQVPGRP
ncbi:FAD-binding monooxygenase [Nesterenkonia alkaliphila]|uniref:FAD-binding monooxygenase n=2 Tax=Nesterenkonia alkaliphila TaxID=1463631 RepID=A0A7K1UII7_9MICC|nr:FAD-dependent monooxygenase [Nesterenkonia alkaliphila]MVT26293.1 FAD-binding monooxygenase [Nesterenkonia alkaliphila]